jgi:hypothetical protein
MEFYSRHAYLNMLIYNTVTAKVVLLLACLICGKDIECQFTIKCFCERMQYKEVLSLTYFHVKLHIISQFEVELYFKLDYP